MLALSLLDRWIASASLQREADKRLLDTSLSAGLYPAAANPGTILPLGRSGATQNATITQGILWIILPPASRSSRQRKRHLLYKTLTLCLSYPLPQTLAFSAFSQSLVLSPNWPFLPIESCDFGLWHLTIVIQPFWFWSVLMQFAAYSILFVHLLGVRRLISITLPTRLTIENIQSSNPLRHSCRRLELYSSQKSIHNEIFQEIIWAITTIISLSTIYSLILNRSTSTLSHI